MVFIKDLYHFEKTIENFVKNYQSSTQKEKLTLPQNVTHDTKDSPKYNLLDIALCRMKHEQITSDKLKTFAKQNKNDLIDMFDILCNAGIIPLHNISKTAGFYFYKNTLEIHSVDKLGQPHNSDEDLLSFVFYCLLINLWNIKNPNSMLNLDKIIYLKDSEFLNLLQKENKALYEFYYTIYNMKFYENGKPMKREDRTFDQYILWGRRKELDYDFIENFKNPYFLSEYIFNYFNHEITLKDLKIDFNYELYFRKMFPDLSITEQKALREYELKNFYKIKVLFNYVVNNSNLFPKEERIFNIYYTLTSRFSLEKHYGIDKQIFIKNLPLLVHIYFAVLFFYYNKDKKIQISKMCFKTKQHSPYNPELNDLYIEPITNELYFNKYLPIIQELYPDVKNIFASKPYGDL